MSERKINLNELFDNNFDCYTEIFEHSLDDPTCEQALSKDKFKELCMEFGKQLLELAAENAEVTVDEIWNFPFVDKQSILDTINQVE